MRRRLGSGRRECGAALGARLPKKSRPISLRCSSQVSVVTHENFESPSGAPVKYRRLDVFCRAAGMDAVLRHLSHSEAATYMLDPCSLLTMPVLSGAEEDSMIPVHPVASYASFVFPPLSASFRLRGRSPRQRARSRLGPARTFTEQHPSVPAAGTESTTTTVHISDEIASRLWHQRSDSYFAFDSARLNTDDTRVLDQLATCFESGPLQGAQDESCRACRSTWHSGIQT